MPASRQTFTHAITVFVSVAIVALGLTGTAQGGIVTTSESLTIEQREDRARQIEKFVSRQDVAERLAAYQVSPADVTTRIAALSDAELLQLQTAIEDGVAGGDALGLIGAVFLVLLILELVGVTDIFKAI